MTDANGPGLTATVAFRLGVLGTIAADRFVTRIEPYGLKAKHAGLLAALDAGAAASQQELAGLMGVAPSVMVSLADQLEELGAVQRVRDPRDRRRQVLTLTDTGRDLLARCAAQAAEVDAELTAGLTPALRASLDAALGTLAADAGLPAPH